jgi:thioredoxin reductase (NADPH)
MRASKAMQDRVAKNEKIEVIWNTTLVSVWGDWNLMNHVVAENVITKEQQTIEAHGLFYAIWHTPNTGFLNWQIELDEAGYIITKPWSTYTSVEWVFAAWDVQDHVYRQAITSAWTWCMAALDAERWLASKE